MTPDDRATPCAPDFGPVSPLFPRHGPPPPLDALPSVLRGWVEGLAFELQVPEGLALVPALGALAVAAGGRFRATPRPGWIEPLNLYVCGIAEPGERKSAVVSAAIAPLHAHEAAENGRTADDRTRKEDDRNIAERRLKRATSRVESAGTPEERAAAEADVRTARAELDALPPVPRALRLLAEDVTPERLVGLLADQGGRLAVISAEGGLLASILGKRYAKNGGAHLDPILKAHAGDPIRVDRVHRDAVSVERPALTLALLVQRAILTGLARDPSLRGVGLLQRFAFVVPESPLGHRRIAPPAAPASARADLAAIVARILKHPDRRDAGEFVPHDLTFSAAAAAAELVAFETKLEPRLGPDGDLEALGGWAEKLAGLVVRLAGLFALAGAALLDRVPESVGVSEVRAAIRLGEWFLAHALVAFGAMGVSDDQIIADRLVRWVRRRALRQFTERDALHALTGSGSKVRAAEDLLAPLKLLADLNYLRLSEVPEERRPGRPSSPTWDVNPAVLGERVSSVSSEPEEGTTP